MQSVYRAVIDVGTNSVKLLVAEVLDSAVRPIVEKSEQTRLGQGFYETRQLLPEAISQTADAVGRYTLLAHGHGAQDIRIVATSAARDAINKAELIQALETASSLKVEVISGEQEAEWVFRGVTTDPQLHGHKLLILDVGGGSTEFILGEKGHHQFRQSFDVGSVRLFEKLRPADPPGLQDLVDCRKWLDQFFNEQLAPRLKHLVKGETGPQAQLVGTGGTTTILARMQHGMTDFDRDKIEGIIITREQVKDWMVQLWSVSLAERKKIIGLPQKRADIIPMGAAIYEAVMDHFGFDTVYVSTRGLRFGAVMDRT
ncbi:MAG: Ppx/GppA phosphatase [Verrucomicrobiales bacterium]|nr:Ppx/GppA phosphatase [Verrucomicrobiales bacterium]